MSQSSENQIENFELRPRPMADHVEASISGGMPIIQVYRPNLATHTGPANPIPQVVASEGVRDEAARAKFFYQEKVDTRLGLPREQLYLPHIEEGSTDPDLTFGYTSIYVKAFSYGMRFPFSPFVNNLLITINRAPGVEHSLSHYRSTDRLGGEGSLIEREIHSQGRRRGQHLRSAAKYNGKYLATPYEVPNLKVMSDVRWGARKFHFHLARPLLSKEMVAQYTPLVDPPILSFYTSYVSQAVNGSYILARRADHLALDNNSFHYKMEGMRNTISFKKNLNLGLDKECKA
ncbi:hypothetical protein LIER_29761 [Lithospermum erythrorhizon]|uniref:Uncharacterized protein n=1 Tax=Lithospermum erythrorhizon TaxID=34254 RepID=A0AAV3RKA2_LITER